MNPQLPTVGRTVLFVLPITHRRAGEIRPAIVVRVNPDSVNLSVQMDGPNDYQDDGAYNTTWVGSASHDQDGKAPGSWHWMPVQQAGGGFDARIKALEDMLVQSDELPRDVVTVPLAAQCQPSIFESKPAEQKAQDDRESHSGYVAKAVQQLEATLAKQLLAAVEASTSPLVESFAKLHARLLNLEADIQAINDKQPVRQRADISEPMTAAEAYGKEEDPVGL